MHCFGFTDYFDSDLFQINNTCLFYYNQKQSILWKYKMAVKLKFTILEG